MQTRSHPVGRWRWTVACGLAEFGGIALAALWWVILDRIGPSPAGALAKGAMILAKGTAGIIEGSILGLVQASVLKPAYPRLSRPAWVAATATLATLGWLIGSAPSILITADPASSAPPFDPSLGATSLFALLFGLVVGALFGAAQWLVFRKAARGAHWWIPANMGGWAVALPLIYLAASIGTGAPGLLEIALRGLIGGLAAGLLFGFVTSLFLRQIHPR